MVDVSIIVPARNAASTIERTLRALTSQRTECTYEVIVVDGDSSDDTVSRVSSFGEAVTLLHNPELEPGSSRNLGVREASGAVLAFTDADCEPDQDWLPAGLWVLERTGADIVQGMVLPAREPGPFDRTVKVISEHGLYETANLFVKRAVFERIGEFEPVAALGQERKFGEDVWFAWRAKRAGAQTAFTADAIVRHEVFDGTLADFLAEEARVRYFPGLVALVPELRAQFLHRRLFLSKFSLRFDAALLSLALAAITRRRSLGALGAGQYALALAREVARAPSGQRRAAGAARLLGDAIRFIALAYGSIAARSIVV